jgi:catechol 2,3-dioxygenase-like lactoylglutathione lyase family enzyme
MLKPTHVAETVLYVDDMDRSEKFYGELFDSRTLHRDERLCALRIADEQVLLLFRRGGSVQPSHLPGGVIPAHDGAGPLHVCFGINAADLRPWEEKLKRLRIAVESRVQWPQGVTSLYFRDPDQHLVELATPGLWS